MEKDISDSVHVTDGLSGNHALHVQASGAKPVETQTASYLARAEQQVGAASGAFALKGGRNVNGQELIDIGTIIIRWPLRRGTTAGNGI